MPYAKNKGSLINNKGGAFKVSSTPSRMQWAAQVVRHFLSVNIQLSTLDRIDEWSQEAKDYSKTWSNDGNTITPWRFQGFDTPNMTPERPWGNNTPEIDILANRLAGTEKYTTYHNQYDKYNYIPYNSQTGEGGTYEPTVDAIITETDEEVRMYYWNTFGYSTNGKGDNTSNWLYPIWGKDNLKYYPSRTSSSPDIWFIMRNDNKRIDNEGFLVYEGFPISKSLFMPSTDNISNIEDFTDSFYLNSVSESQLDYYYKSDKLCIITDYNKENIYNVVLTGAQSSASPMQNAVKDYVYSKSYAEIKIRDYSGQFSYPFPILRGDVLIKPFYSFPIKYPWFSYQESVPLRRANITLDGGFNNIDQEVPISFTNITEKIGQTSGAFSILNSFTLATWNIDRAWFDNCPNLKSLGSIYSNLLRIENCPKLTSVIITGRPQRFGPHTEFEMDIDSNDKAININAHICNVFGLYRGGLTQYQVDAIILAFAEHSNTNTNGQLNLDNLNLDDNSDYQHMRNSKPSDTTEINNAIATLQSNGWTVITESTFIRT